MVRMVICRHLTTFVKTHMTFTKSQVCIQVRDLCYLKMEELKGVWQVAQFSHTTAAV